MLPAVAVCGWWKFTPDLDPTPVGSHGCNWSSSMQILNHQAILQTNLTWPLTHLWPLTSWTCVHYINKPSLVPTGIQLFKWDHFHIFSLSYKLTSDDLWPWYVVSDLINKWGFTCCIYDPTLVEIHLNMWKVEPHVNLFSQQQQTTMDRAIPMCLSY